MKSPGEINAAPASSRWDVAAVAVLLAVAAVLVYSNSFATPFVLDDDQSIAGNATIRSLWPPWSALSPPRGGGLTVEGRPVLNLSLAVNYALHGIDVRGYHVANLIIHLGAALLLFGLVRRTLLQSPLRARFGNASTRLAALIAALWLLHPLQTESVTYVIQRAESLCGFFYFLTLYSFIRAVGDGSTRAWWFLSAIGCLLGMATKEVMVSAPLIVLLYDRTFVAGNFPMAWRQRRVYYTTLASTWVLLAWLVVGFHARSGSAGFQTGVSSWHYALTQCQAVLLYLKLSVWPHPLVFDYGTQVITRLTDVLPQALALLALVVGTLIALWRRPAVGFLGVWFFALLAPSSSIVPVLTQSMAEHRMYLPLAAVIALLVCGSYARFGRFTLVASAIAVAGCGLLTVQRNEDYRNHAALWGDTVAKRPDNTRARNNLGLALREAHRLPEALAQFDAALRLDPASVAIRNNRATLLIDLGRLPEALSEIDDTLRRAPTLAEAYDTKADVLRAMGRLVEADENYAHALRLKPELARESTK